MEKWFRTSCYMCHYCCGMLVRTIDGRPVEIAGDPEKPMSQGRLCAKGHAALAGYYQPRVRKPLLRTNPNKAIGVDPQWREIEFDEARDLLLQKLTKVRADNPKKLAIINFDLHASRLLQPWIATFGTPNAFPGAAQYFCGPGVHAVLHMTQGAFVTLPDYPYCNYLILIGTQVGFGGNILPLYASPALAEARARGMKLVVVDPGGSNAAGLADEWVPIRPGTDAALALAMLNVLLNDRQLYDANFLRLRTNAPYLVGPGGQYVRDPDTGKPLVWDEHNGRPICYDQGPPEAYALSGSYEVKGILCQPSFQRLRDHVRSYTPEQVAEVTTIPAKTIRRIAEEFGEAARIGATIRVEGVSLPYRPACVQFFRGVSQHRHSMLNCIAVQLLNIVVGAIDVPGGSLGVNPRGPWWEMGEDADGMLLSSQEFTVKTGPESYPARPVRAPESLTLLDLMPVSGSVGAAFVEALLHPEKFRLDYLPEVLINCRSNIMKNSTNPEEIAVALRRIPFLVCFAFELNETTEFADLVIPDAHFLERLDVIPNKPNNFIPPGLGEWFWVVRQPVAAPPPGVKHWVEFLYDLAGPLEIKEDLYSVLNAYLHLENQFRLDPKSDYSWEEINNAYLMSLFGPDHGLTYFKEQGLYISGKKRIEEAYPLSFFKARIPIYFEHFIEAGRLVRDVTSKMGLEWDVADYQPLPDWTPCPSFRKTSPEYDLFAVNFKLPYHTFSRTADNPWLMEISERGGDLDLWIPAEAGQRKGLTDGDLVWIESEFGFRVRGKVRLVQGLHPEVVGIPGGFGRRVSSISKKNRGPDFNGLLPHRLDRMDTLTGALDACVRIRVIKEEHSRAPGS